MEEELIYSSTSPQCRQSGVRGPSWHTGSREILASEETNQNQGRESIFTRKNELKDQKWKVQEENEICTRTALDCPSAAQSKVHWGSVNLTHPCSLQPTREKLGKEPSECEEEELASILVRTMYCWN